MTERSASWPRALALFFAAVSLTVVGPAALIAIPFVLLVLFLPVERWTGLVAGAVAAFLAAGGVTRDGIWFVERGWGLLIGGWFVAITLRWPTARLATRAVGAATGAVGVVSAGLALRPGSWGVLEWMVSNRIRAEFTSGIAGLEALGMTRTPEVSESLEATLEAQMLVFPATTALASAAGVGVAWWIYDSLARSGRGELGRLRDFDFNDHLVWLFIAGLALVLLGGGGSTGRVGWNAVVFMAAFYTLRGLGVVLSLVGSVSWLWGVPLALAAVFFWPVLAAGTAVVGLGDTWLHIREGADGEGE